MNDPLPSIEIQREITELSSRIKKLEDIIFDGGLPGFGKRLEELDGKLARLRGRSFSSLDEIERKIDEVLRVVAELKEAVGQGRQVGRGYSGGGQAQGAY